MKPTQERIKELNEGQVEAKNLMELLAIDFNILLGNTIPDFKMPVLLEKSGITQKMRLIAENLYDWKKLDIFEFLAVHPSDTLRGLGCYVLACHNTSFKEKLQLVTSLADDTNSGVREWAWIALRPELISNLEAAIQILADWTQDLSPNKRRYACEITRPRGVWCSHIQQLRQTPWLALEILSPLKNDSARYVQLSVGNWLNDAGKDHPTWVKELCQEWEKTSPTPETKKICKRGLRNL